MPLSKRAKCGSKNMGLIKKQEVEGLLSTIAKIPLIDHY